MQMLKNGDFSGISQMFFGLGRLAYLETDNIDLVKNLDF